MKCWPTFQTIFCVITLATYGAGTPVSTHYSFSATKTTSETSLSGRERLTSRILFNSRNTSISVPTQVASKSSSPKSINTATTTLRSHHSHSKYKHYRTASNTTLYSKTIFHSRPTRLTQQQELDLKETPTASPWFPAQNSDGTQWIMHPTTESHPVGEPGQEGVGNEPVSADGWRDATMTWYDGKMLADPACYNGAESQKYGESPAYQPTDNSLIAAVVRDYGYASCYSFIELARFPKDGSRTPAASVVVQVVDECAEGCWAGRNASWFDVSKSAFQALFPQDIGRVDVHWRIVEGDAVQQADRSRYPAWPSL